MLRSSPASACILLLASAAALAQPGPAAHLVESPSHLEWQLSQRHEHVSVAVVGPEGFAPVMRRFGTDESVSVDLTDVALPDGQYTWEIRTVPVQAPGVRARTRRVTERGLEARASDGWIQGSTESGWFQVRSGSIVSSGGLEEASGAASADSGNQPGLHTIASADQVINDDLIVSFSACIGNDCVNGESFGFDTLRLKENNLRIKFQDTSNSASFPSNDWQITANDSSNGGANKFSIDDIDGGRTPFTIEAGAPSNSLFVDDGGRLGFGTATPVVELHAVDGDSPTLRLEQDGSSGFTPQTWDLAGNETNFFVRDVTNGSRLPFRIKPSAPTNSIYVDTDGDVGLGTTSPDASLSVVETAAGVNNVFRTENNGNSTWQVEGTASGQQETFYLNWAHTIDDLNLTYSGSSNNFRFSFNDGNLTIKGDFITDANTYPDYVFADDYDLMPIGDLAEFIERERHLPNVPSQADVDARGGTFSVNDLQIALLEKIEELTLYTIDQQKTIDELTARLEALEAGAE